MSTIQKKILVADRLRRPPATGWSWVDRRFLREHGDHLSREAMLLYLFLAAVADRHGLSFYSDHTLTSRLRLSPQVLEKARQELLDRDLIAFELPLVQVLALPVPGVQRRAEPGQGLMLLGDVFRQVAAAATSARATSDRTTSDRTTTDRITSDGETTDRGTSDRATPDKRRTTP
jgi:hypothetical protein